MSKIENMVKAIEDSVRANDAYSAVLNANEVEVGKLSGLLKDIETANMQCAGFARVALPELRALLAEQKAWLEKEQRLQALVNEVREHKPGEVKNLHIHINQVEEILNGRAG